jgi:tryptophan synthase beta chain
MPTLEAPALPDARGRFGPYGGRYVPETLMFALEELTAAYEAARHDPAFQTEFRTILNEYRRDSTTPTGSPGRPAGPASTSSART